MFPSHLSDLLKKFPQNKRFKIPPPVFLMMEGEVLHFDEAQRLLRIRFPVKEAYQNPMGYMQGGMIAAAIDNVLGPLSYLTFPPSVTKRLEIDYLCPVRDKEPAIIVEAKVVEENDLVFVMEVEVRNEKGRLLATGRAVHAQLRQR